MLIRCPRCGKPVYAPDGRVRLECGYCYHCFDLAQPPGPLEPEMIDWKKPIYDATGGLRQAGDMCRWLALLGDYADARQRIERIRRNEQNRLRASREDLRTAAEPERVAQIIRDLEQIDKGLCNPEELDQVLKAAREKHARLRQQEAQKKLLFFKESIENASSAGIAEQLIADLLKLPPMREREDVLAMAYEKRGLLMQKEAAEKAKKEKWKKRKKRLLRSLPFLCATLILCYALLSIHVFQPGQLETAERLAQTGAYAEAEQIYLSLLSRGFFRNQSVAAQAREALPRLRNRWAEALAEQGDLEAAIEKYKAAGNEESARETVIAYAEALAEQGRTNDAIAVLESAGSAPEVLDLLRVMYVRQADEMGKQIISQWTGEGKEIGDDAYQALEETGARFRTADAQLHYWSLLADAGIDLTLVYPNGAEVSDFTLPKESTDFPTFDAAKPLFIQRREDDYLLSFLDMNTKSAVFKAHNPDRSDHYTVTLLPECWQRLPKERRASSLQEVTSIFALNLTYLPAGSFYGQYRTYEQNRTNSGIPQAFHGVKRTEYSYFPLFHAKMELLLWKYPGDEIMVLWNKTNAPRLEGSSSDNTVVIDWPAHFFLPVSTVTVGLSGTFNEQLIDAQLQRTYEKLLKLEGE